MASIKEIAEKANVSIGTVDRVIHDRGRVSRKTAARVRQIMETLNYRPNVFAQNLRRGRAYRFGVIMPKLDQDSGYWRMLYEGLENAHEQLRSQKIEVRCFHFDRYSEGSFIEAGEAALEAQLDGVILAPIYYQAVLNWTKQLGPNVPHVYVDSQVPGTPALAYIGQDAFQSGVLSARLMQMVVHEGGVIAMLCMAPATSNIRRRAEGFEQSFGDKHSFQVRSYEIDNEVTASAYGRVTQKILEENDTLRGIYVTNACGHLVADELHNHLGRTDIRLIGYDLISENVRYLETGEIDFLISQVPQMQGYQAVYSLYRHVVLKETVEPLVMVPLDIITRENVAYTHTNRWNEKIITENVTQ